MASLCLIIPAQSIAHIYFWFNAISNILLLKRMNSSFVSKYSLYLILRCEKLRFWMDFINNLKRLIVCLWETPTWWTFFDQVKTLIRTRRKSEKSDLNVRTNPILVNASTGGRSQNVFFWGWPEEANPRKVISSTRIFFNLFISFLCLYFCVFVLTRMLTNLFLIRVAKNNSDIVGEFPTILTGIHSIFDMKI